jgi:CheY-like chemotaxis protein
MDVHMPDMDGFETVKRIKQNETLREIPSSSSPRCTRTIRS